jgi:hypothetical protein
MVSMKKLPTDERARIVSCLIEGCSIRSTVRMTGFSKNTVAKLLVDMGDAWVVGQSETPPPFRGRLGGGRVPRGLENTTLPRPLLRGG